MAGLRHNEVDDALTDAHADESPPRQDPESSRTSRQGQGMNMDNSNQLLVVEVRLDVDATPPSKDATRSGKQVLDEEVAGSYQQKLEGEFLGSGEQDKGSTADEEKTEKETTRKQKPTRFDKKFYEAVRRGKLDEVKSMLDSDNALLDNRFTKFEENAIQVAVVAGKGKIVSELLARVRDLELLKQKNNYGETALTLAAAGGKKRIVKMLVDKYEDLVDVQNSQGYLPVVVAALYGHMDIVSYLLPWYIFVLFEKEEKDRSLNTGNKVKKVKKVLLKEESNQAKEKHPKNYDQLYQDNFKFLSVSINTELDGYVQNYNFKVESKDLKPVSSSPDDDATSYEYSSKHNGFMLFQACIKAGIYDIALAVFKLRPDKCIEEMKKENGATLYPLALADLAKGKINPFFAWVYDNISSARLVCGMKSMDNRVGACDLLREITKYQAKPTVLGMPMLMAILQENVDFIKVVIEECPDVLWFEIDGLTLFAHAISKGLEKIYTFAYKRPETGHLASFIPDRDGNTLLHQAAKLSPSPFTQSLGPALQMQRELQRFKEMEKKVPMCKGILNKNNQTPKDLFGKEHKKLKNQAQMWLKDVATSCSVVATLIVTIMFTAAFTAPGGYKEDTGIPTNLRSKYFSAYIISDAFSLFFSCTSAMIFLGIHTSLFREEDFLNRLPLALMSGLCTLFLSIATMLVAFGTALVIMLREHFVWISIPLLMLGSIPVSIYAILHVRIFFHVLHLTFRNPTN
ncbi:uncharacterized protein LOC127805010 [Diospyros lotus]|uniref:uncharacterized protein LOC127805010 n=1 Tax=Diospyros lotus TaxID=55363 RepID=UPI00224D6606|nr:uncharacterized protein LOC127805010 [Diospyros lotus]